METKNIAVIGLGSMGKRRIRLLKEISSEFNIVGVDFKAENRKEVEKTFSIKTFGNMDEAMAKNQVEAVVVSTSPISHETIIKQALNNDLHVFAELNLVDSGYNKNIQLTKAQNRILFLSSTPMYRKEIQYIKKKISATKKQTNYSYHVGQYLPDWHPWESYKDFFVGDKRTNGTREILAIELPWIVDTFGKIKNVYTLKSKMTDLEIDFNDSCITIIEHENGHKGTLHANVVSRKAVRNLEIYGEELYISWNGTPEGLCEYSIEKKEEMQINLYNSTVNDKNYNKTILENAYKDELINFFNCIEGKEEPLYSFEKDKEILAIIDKIEKDY